MEEKKYDSYMFLTGFVRSIYWSQQVSSHILLAVLMSSTQPDWSKWSNKQWTKHWAICYTKRTWPTLRCHFTFHEESPRFTSVQHQCIWKLWSSHWDLVKKICLICGKSSILWDNGTVVLSDDSWFLKWSEWKTQRPQNSLRKMTVKQGLKRKCKKPLFVSKLLNAFSKININTGFIYF